jgi:hypothetical protein
MKKYSFLLFTLLFVNVLQAQLMNNNSYRNSNNPLYWQNRKPHAAYWQQDVHYNIAARIDEEAKKIDAIEDLEYFNNSPDTLQFVYFHLYQNAFIDKSYLRALEKANFAQAPLGPNERVGKGIEINAITVDGANVNVELDNTILKVYLPKPLLPNDKVNLSLMFTTYYDKTFTRRRMQMYNAWGFTHFNGVQWYPKMSVYDAKFGWDTYQHLNKEFYGDFGSFDVQLDFPSNYIVEATGILQNKNEVLPDSLLRKIDIKNFAKAKPNDTPSIIIPYEKGKRKIWKFHADNVHDFAFTADPSYRMSIVDWEGIKCVGLVQEPHAATWQNSASLVAKIIQTFSRDFGRYQYPKMVAADANDGMEYPMLTLDGGSDPDYRGLLIHEIAHNWFYGMVGNNETYRASLDEGFTQYLTAWGMQKIDGDTILESLPSNYIKRKSYQYKAPFDTRVLNVYTHDALTHDDATLNTHSDDFNNALGHDGGYRLVYYKTASMLVNLQYTLGDELFSNAMKHYFAQWQFAHPYFEDFRNSIIQYTKVDLNWFFDQWIETTKLIDYKVASYKRINDNDSFAISLKRKGSMQMPIDFSVIARNGAAYKFHIPNTWFKKNTNASILPKWFGYGILNETYDAVVQIPSGISKVVIDPSHRLADINMLDNSYSKSWNALFDKMDFKFDFLQSVPFDRLKMHHLIRPDIWWNPADGIKLGIHAEGSYQQQSMHEYKFTAWLNTHILQGYDYLSTKSESWYKKYAPVNYILSYQSPITLQMPKLKWQLYSSFVDGLQQHKLGIAWAINKSNDFKVVAQTMWRPFSYDIDYLLYRNEWSSVRLHPNSSLNLSWTHSYQYQHGNGKYVASVRAPFFVGTGANAFNYTYAQLEAVNNNIVNKLLIKTRFMARYGKGTNVPNESALYLAGASPEELMNNKYTRSIGFIPTDWQGYSTDAINHFQQGGGLNLRGYAGYVPVEEKDGAIYTAFKGTSGMAMNVEIEFSNYIKWRPAFFRKWIKADAYAFADAGVINLSSNQSGVYNQSTYTSKLSAWRADAGIGAAFTIKNYGPFTRVKPLVLRIDLPLFINRTPANAPDYAAFRWVVGIGRCF